MEMVYDYINEQLKQTQEKIHAACRRVNRDPEEVTLLLATKTVPSEKIQVAVDAGYTLLGENKVQELAEKHGGVKNEAAEWHFIGHLQTNKINNVIPYVTGIQSIDRLKLGKKLHNSLTRENRKLDILVQVNTSYEESKFGVAPENAVDLIEELAALDSLRIKGLMTIGKLSANEEETRECFRLLQSVKKQAVERNIPGVEMDVLSMGMSGDFETAVEEGATMVRVGTSIFGEREYPDSYYWNEQSSAD